MLLQSFKNSLRSQTITSNSVHSVYEEQSTLKDPSWETPKTEALSQVKVLFPIMMDTSQKFEDMQNNLSFEIQKMRFFNSLFKYNLFFELGLDVQEWTDKVFEHCCKMILLAVSSNLKTDTQSQIHRKYEITENFSQEFTSQKSVFDLHFWYKRVIGREANTTFHNSEETKSEAIDETTSNTILTQAFRTLHYFVEVRHKYLCASTSDKIHEKHWNGKLKSEAGEYLDQQHITDESNKISATVLEEIKTRAENNHKIRFPTVNELFTTMANRLESTGEVSLILFIL